MTRDNAVKLDEYLGDIDNAVKVLQEYQAKGESVYVEFNGHKLYSADITLDGAYKEITGQTKAEFDKTQEEWLENDKKEQAERKAQATQSIPEWLERGEKLIPADKKEAWEKYVKRSAQSELRAGDDVKQVLDIMEKISSGASQEDIKKLIGEQGHSGTSYALVRNVVKEFLGQDIEKIESADKKQEASRAEDDKSDYEVTSKDLSLMTKERVGTKMIRKIKEFFNKIRHHDTDIGGR